MIVENPAEEKITVSNKKTYIKPTLNKVRLVADEAVLAYCKTGIQTACRPNPTCASVFRS